MRPKLLALALPVLLALAALAAPAAQASVLPQTRYFFHAAGEPVNQIDKINAPVPSFDTTAPTSGTPSIAGDTSLLTNTGSAGVGNPTWAGPLNGTINTLKIDLWQEAPVGAALSSAAYDVTLWVGATKVALPTFSAPVDPKSVPSEVTFTFAGAPFPIDATGQTVTVDINGHYSDAESATAILYDSTSFPSGFSVNVPAPAGVTPITVVPGSTSFNPRVTLPGSTGYGEPSLAIAPPGTKGTVGQPQTIYVSAPRGTVASKQAGKSSPLWRSDDGGLTWSNPIDVANVGPVVTGLAGGDTDIVVDKDGNLYYEDLWLGNDTISVTEDKGATFFGSPVSHAHIGDDRAWFGYSAKESALYMAYDGVSGAFLDKASLATPLGPKGGLIWSQESLVTDNGTRGCICPPGYPVLVDDSRSGPLPYVYLTLASGSGIDVVRSDDGGQTFSHHLIPNTGGGTTTLRAEQMSSLDEQGNLYVTWSEVKGGISDVFLATSTDHGQTWNGPYNVSQPLGAARTALFPSVASEIVNGVAHVGIAFYGTPATVDNNNAPAGTQWNVYYADSTDGSVLSANPTFTMTNIDPNFHQGQISTGGTTGSADRSLLDFFTLHFDASHLANIIYSRGTGTSGANPVQLTFIKQAGGGGGPAATSLVYGGDTSAQNGATASYSATLTAGGTPVPGATVTFTLGSQDPVTGTTDASGVATATQAVSLDAGSYTITANYAGSPTLQASSDSEGFTVTGATPPTNTFSVVQVGPQRGGGEPSLAVGPEDNLYVSYPGSGMSFFRSTDHGQSWTEGAKADTSSGDTSVNTDSSGAVYQTNLNGLRVGPNLLQTDLYKSKTFGASWTKAQGAVVTSNASNQPFLTDRQWADAYIPPGGTTDTARVYLTYHDWAPNMIWVNASTDGGGHFGTPTPVITDPQALAASFCDTVPGGLKVVQSGPHAGRVYVLWIAGDLATNVATGCNATQLQTFHTVWIAYSDNADSASPTWTDRLVYDAGVGKDTSALFADLALDNQGNPYAAFSVNLADLPRTDNTPPVADTTVSGGSSYVASDGTSLGEFGEAAEIVQEGVEEADHGLGGGEGDQAAAAAADQWDVYVMASFDGGTTWNGSDNGTGEPSRVTSDTGTHLFPAIAVGDPGRVDVAYLGTPGIISELPYGKPFPGGGDGFDWKVYMAQSLDLQAADPTWTTDAVKAEPIHTGDICTLGLFCEAGTPLGADRDLLDFIDIGVDASGLAHIAYTDDRNAPAGIYAGNQTGGKPAIVLPGISIADPSVTEGNSGTTPADFTVSLSEPSTHTITVQAATSDGTATAGEDYVAVSGPLTFAPGETSKTLSVDVKGDTKYEPDETFTVTLSSPVNATIDSASATGTILNDDTQPADLQVTNEASSGSVQADSPVTYTVTVTNAGPGNASGVTLTDLLPANTEFGSATPSQGSCSGTYAQLCDLGAIASGDSATVQIVLTPIEPGQITASASVAGNEPDPEGSNDSQDAIVTVNAQPKTRYVRVDDDGFHGPSATPGVTAAMARGFSVQFNFLGSSANSARDASGLDLYDSGTRAAVSHFRYTYSAAGKYSITDDLGHTGVISVSLTGPLTGTLGTAFNVSWATVPAPSGFVYDVQYRKPGTTKFVGWKLGTTAGNADFTPTSSTGGTGDYAFRARLRKVSISPNPTSDYSGYFHVLVS